MSTEIPPIVLSSDEEQEDDEHCVPETKKFKMTEPVEGKQLIISGVKVKFPLEPYQCQTAIMFKVISGCKSSNHCLLESPTGSGKTLALLCSSLAWQDSHNDKLLQDIINGQNNVNMGNNEKESCHCLSNTATTSSPSAPENIESSSVTCSPSCSENNCDNCNLDALKEALENEDDSPTKRKVKIFYGTRTHRQITQVVKEFGRTVYKDKKMTILSSREHTCIQDSTRNKTDLCNELLDPTKFKDGCKYYNENNKCSMSSITNAERAGLPRVWDIEDLKIVGKKLNSCPYFAARDLMEEADIVFCPYNYLMDPNIREAMRLDLTGHVIILDEAHNIEDLCSEIGSRTIQENELERALHECDRMAKKTGNYIYRIIGHFVTLMLNCMRRVQLCQSDPVKNLYASFNCKQALDLFRRNQIDEEQCREFERVTVDALNEMSKAKNRNKYVGDNDTSPIMSPFLKVQLENLLKLLATIVSHEDMDHYVLIVTEETKAKEYTFDSSDWISLDSEMRTVKIMRLSCLNPGLIFKQVTERARSVILTSGTLAPMESFASELKTDFKFNLQGIHVTPRENIYVNCISRGFNNMNLRGNFKSVENPEYQKEVGVVLREICRIVPHGVLCFFTSYRVLNIMLRNWKSRQNQIYNEIAHSKRIFIEPRKQTELKEVMIKYREAIEETASQPVNGINGCLFLGVMRGKLAEGEDFKNEEARCVVTIGLPYAAKNIEIDVKMKYNEMHESEGLLSGDEWYEVQAYRALNQALGRCIRHANDWGAILLIDERFKNPKFQKKLPGWIKSVFSQNRDPHSWVSDLVNFVQKHKMKAHN